MLNTFEYTKPLDNIDNIFGDKDRIPIQKNQNLTPTYKKIKLTKFPKTIKIYAYLNNEHTGQYINGTQDYFYQTLTDLSKQHKSILPEEIKYTKTYTNKIFRFQSSKKFLDIRDKNNNIITNTKQIIGKKVCFNLRVIPYHNEKKATANLLIRVIHINI